MNIILFCNLIEGNNMGKLFIKNLIIRENIKIIIKSLEFPFFLKTPFMRLYFEIYLKDRETDDLEDYLFFLKECIIVDFDNRII